MKRFINLSILVFGTLFVYLAITNIFSFKCIFKDLFGIRCPGCGLTRSFISILNFDFISAIKYNFLGIPIFISFMLISFFMIIDIFKNSDKTLKFINKILQTRYIELLVLIVVVMLINNIQGI